MASRSARSDAQTRQIMGNFAAGAVERRPRKAVLFVTHDLEEAIALRRPRRDHVGGLPRASSATGGCRCRARATSRKWRDGKASFTNLHRENLERAEGRSDEGYAAVDAKCGRSADVAPDARSGN